MYIPQEYAELCYQTSEPSVEELINNHPTASLPANKPRNRYKEILPLEENRIKLLSKDGDYINASLVQYENNKTGLLMKPVICCQAPLYTTIIDFWLMIWQQNSPVICNLNQVFQGDKYWPTKKEPTKVYGEIRVTLEMIHKLEKLDTVVRQLRLLRIGDIDTERTIYLIHYRGWPDASVPDSSLPIRELVRLVSYNREIGYQNGICGPCVVHCLAGIGRSGTFIALLGIIESPPFIEKLRDSQFRSYLDNLNREDKKLSEQSTPGYRVHLVDDALDEYVRNNFNIFDIVLSFRQQRNRGMVQTGEQYAFIYRTLKDELLEPTSPSKVVAILQQLIVSDDISTWRNIDPVIRMDESDVIPPLIKEVSLQINTAILTQEYFPKPGILTKKRSSEYISTESSQTTCEKPSKRRNGIRANGHNSSEDEESKDPSPHTTDLEDYPKKLLMDYPHDLSEELLQKYFISSDNICAKVVDVDE